MSSFDFIQINAEKDPDQIAVKTSDQDISYKTLLNMITITSQNLKDQGVKKGDCVLVFLPNCLEFIISVFAMSLIGAVAVLCDIKYNDEVNHVMNECSIKWVITNDKGALGFIETNPELRIFRINEDNSLFSFDERPKIYVSASFPRGPQMDDRALVLYTSGSTGKPKGVVNTYRNLLASVHNYLATFYISNTDKLIAVTPFYHSYALGSCMLAGLAAGATLIVFDKFNPRRILQSISEDNATVFHGVPYMYDLLNQQYDKSVYSMKSLRFCVSAGTPLLENIARELFKKTGIAIHQEYGSSETGTIALNLSDDLNCNLKSVGCALKNVNIHIEKEHDENAGHIKITSPAIAQGYVGMEPFCRTDYSTGDIGKVEEGFLHITGRIKKIINVAGLKVNPYEIEHLLLSHPFISDVLVKGTDHEEFGEVVEALIVKKNNELTVEEITQYCHKHLAAYKTPRIIKWVDTIPKSSLGKAKI